MTLVKPDFNVSEYELYGNTNPYLTNDQFVAVNTTENRVNQQLDWLAQLLGWSGPEYWFSLVSNVDQKRQLLTGSYGVYNSFIYPKLLEIRNWDNTVIIKADDKIQVGQNFYLGDYTYPLQSIVTEGENYILSFGDLTDQFLSDIALNLQLKVDSPLARQYPFNRPSTNGSADISFVVTTSDNPANSLTLSCNTGSNVLLPVVYNVFYAGSRVYFDAPLQLYIDNEIAPGSPTIINPDYDFTKELWYLDIPDSIAIDGAGLSATLVYGVYQLTISIALWTFNGDWNNLPVLENFSGVWGNKGGKLPFNFVFDSLSLHGFDESKSLYVAPLETTLKFNDLLNLVYYQKAQISPTSPGPSPQSQVWWNSETGDFSVFLGDCFNCGPWVEVDYPRSPESPDTPDYVFPDVDSFRSYPNTIGEGEVVRILNSLGLSTSDQVRGLTGTIESPCQVDLFYIGESQIWEASKIEYMFVNEFSEDAPILPGRVPVRVLDSFQLAPSTSSYTVPNLFVTIEEHYPVVLMKDSTEGGGDWFISPPSSLKYIGNTSLFDTQGPADGELFWDYAAENVNCRGAAIFYYNRWEYVTDHWELKGDWVDINSDSAIASPPASLDYGVIKVFCDGTLLTNGENFQTYDYQLSYLADEGSFSFSYKPITFDGIKTFPQIVITDSITTTYRYDITDMVFSGVKYNMTPSALDCTTPLRIWKSDPLFSVDDYSYISGERYINPLVADNNSGPGDNNWERYFIRLPPTYTREGSEWQKVNLICQDFGLWGSPLSPEDMTCPPQESKPLVYEEVVLSQVDPSSPVYIYSEPYLYSNVAYGLGSVEDYENAAVIPGFDIPGDGYYEATLTTYDPLHHRHALVDSNLKKTFGDWVGLYVRASACSSLSGFLVNDLKTKEVEEIAAPLWDASIYKLPPTCVLDSSSSKVDANHYKVGYAFFTADLSAAEEGVFDL